MNILDEIENVKKRKQEELRLKEEKEKQREQERQAEQKLEKQRIAVIWHACESLNESKQFKIEKEKVYSSNSDGYVATLYKVVRNEKSQIGIIRVENDSYEWRGSDESPEQTIYTKNLRLYSNSSNPIIDVSFSDYKFEEYLNDFLKQLANFLTNK